MKSFCLTIEVKSPHIENGLGYMIAFALPEGETTPEKVEEFSVWCNGVKDAVLRAGDLPFNPDIYTKKLAVAELMNELERLNSTHNIKIGGLPGVPAVQIHSTNPFDKQIDIDFTGMDGAFTVTERGLEDLKHAKVKEHGKTSLTDAAKKHFPFERGAPDKKTPGPKGPGL